MAFLHHEPCSRCGSRDNFARYSDGSGWCFGCHHWEDATLEGRIKQLNDRTINNDNASQQTSILLPKDFQKEISEDGLKWLCKYGLLPADALIAGWGWSPYWEQLIFPFYDREGVLCCTQARNFNPQRSRKAKYYNTGEKSRSWTIYHNDSSYWNYLWTKEHGGRGGNVGGSSLKGHKRSLVLTEDAVSSLKISPYSDAMPILGTYVAKEKLKALRAFYDVLYVWLDSDKYREARNIADQAKLLGYESRAIFSEKDPKEYTDEQLQEYLK